MLLITQPNNGSEIAALQNYAYNHFSWEVENAPTSWRLDPIFVKSNKRKVGVPYGTQLFCETVAEQMNWRLIQNPPDWLANINPNYLHRRVRACKLADLIIFEPQFVKPADFKSFQARVYSPDEIEDLKTKNKDSNEILQTDMLVSDIVQFVSEYRFFVSYGVIRSGSCYLLNGEINKSSNWFFDLDRIKNTLNDWLGNDLETVSAVIDVGVLKSGEVAIIESNPAWASGIYGCDLEGVLQTLQYSCER